MTTKKRQRAARKGEAACSPKRPYESKRGARGHVWKRDEDGTLDIFAYNPSEYCNGPLCVKCGYGFCHHCQTGPQVSCTANNVLSVSGEQTTGERHGQD